MFLIRWSNNTYSNPRPLVQDNKASNKSILDIDISLENIENNEVKFKCIFEDGEYVYALSVEGNITSLQGEELLVQRGRYIVKLSDYLMSNPVEMLTTDLCLISDGEIAKNNVVIELFVPSLIRDIKWLDLNTDIRIEFGNSMKTGLISIHDALERILIDKEYDYLIYDHGTGEIADYIGIRITETEVHIHFYHVKAMKARTYNNSVTDMYDVLGQSIKSVTWLKSKSIFRQKVVSRRGYDYCKFIIGDFEDLKNDLFSNRVIRAKIIAVQPSIKKDGKMTEKIAELLAATNHYIKHSGTAYGFEVWGS